MTFAEMLDIVRRAKATLNPSIMHALTDDLERLEKALSRLRDREDRHAVRSPDESDKEAVWEDFEEWAGDFPPESEQQIKDYIESSLSTEYSDEEARAWLREAMTVFGDSQIERKEDHES